MTKAEERKTLEQIKAILAKLPEDSYILTACAGMIEDAQRNIDEDAAYSWQDRAENSDRKLCQALNKVADLEKERADLEKERDDYKKQALGIWKQANHISPEDINEALRALDDLHYYIDDKACDALQKALHLDQIRLLILDAYKRAADVLRPIKELDEAANAIYNQWNLDEA